MVATENSGRFLDSAIASDTVPKSVSEIEG